ncbi:hypothetical protein AVEN_7107-1 [Araneus ventricosus]|uniref:Mos1 transposase HTH domain-containing protein n=1 Tax=Araneus ventricosus TaxID=182803 RepID=A0A4Y2V4M9_ARAVE|nr:hypothetical protein AVEN_7107-1 [Araneus ventricosus]
MKWKINLKFLHKLGKSAGKSHAMLKQLYGDDTMTLKTLYTWFKKFIDGCESIEDEQWSGLLTMADNARRHNTTLVKRFLPQQVVTELSHLPHIPQTCHYLTCSRFLNFKWL